MSRNAFDYVRVCQRCSHTARMKVSWSNIKLCDTFPCVLVLSLEADRQVRGHCFTGSHVDGPISMMVVISLPPHMHGHKRVHSMLPDWLYTYIHTHLRAKVKFSNSQRSSPSFSLSPSWCSRWVISMQVETLRGEKSHRNENCSELVRKHSTLQGATAAAVAAAAAALPWQRWGEHVLESESQGYSISSCFNNISPLWKEYYIPCKYDENTYQISSVSALFLQWARRTCHQG